MYPENTQESESGHDFFEDLQNGEFRFYNLDADFPSNWNVNEPNIIPSGKFSSYSQTLKLISKKKKQIKQM